MGSNFRDGGPGADGGLVMLNEQAAEQFVSPPVTVSVAFGQSVYVSASASLLNGSPDATNQAGVSFWIAFLPAGGALTNADHSPQFATVSGGNAVVVSLSAVISDLAPGTYQVGLAGVFAGGTKGASAAAVTGATSALVLAAPQ